MSSVKRQSILKCLHDDLSRYPNVDRTDPFVEWRDVAASQLRENIFKKFEDTNQKADAAALHKFLAINESAGKWQLEITSSWDEELIGEVRKNLDNFFHPSGNLLIESFNDIFNEGAVGPGSSLRGEGGDFYTKFFSSRLTLTSRHLYQVYRATIATLPSWNQAELNRLATKGEPMVVVGNRLSFVPKNVDISRSICTEPTLNMWYQLGVGNIITKRLKAFFGLDLSNVADVNRELARAGSCDSSAESFSTIDLESASDSMSLRMLELVLPRWVFELLCDLRSPETRLPDGQRLQLNMVSTMGNGFTFPLQTALFSCVVSAVYAQLGISRARIDSKSPTWSVFGDDIIVQRKAYGRVAHLLSLLGFKVNQQKSFSEGPFRESCGLDFFKGFNVRPVFVRKLDDAQDVYLTFNKLVRWSSATGVSLQYTLKYLLKKARFNPVPYWESDDAGFKVPMWAINHRMFNKDRSITYKAVVRGQKNIVVEDGHIKVPRGLRPRTFNPEGLLVAVVKGEFRGGFLVPRQGIGRPRLLRRVALNWEIAPLPDHYVSPFIEGGRRVGSCENNTFMRFHIREAVRAIAARSDGTPCESVFRELFS